MKELEIRNESNIFSSNFGEDEEIDSKVSQLELEEHKWRSRKYFWRMNDPGRVRWDLFIMILCVYNCFIVPFQAAFNPPVLSSVGMKLFNSCFDFIFMIDIAVMFRTSYISSTTGEEEYNLKKIARNYLVTTFWMDLLACLPMDIFSLIFSFNNTALSILNLFDLLKIIRLLRLSRIIMYMNAKDNVKMVLKVINMVFFIVVYIHFQACAFWIIVSSNEQWVPPFDYMYVNTWIFQDTLAMRYW